MKKHKFHLFALTSILFAGLVLVGCAPAQEPPPEQNGPAIVFMQNNTFQPAELTIPAGTTVTWTNEDIVDHTVTSGTRSMPTRVFDERVSPGGTFSITFDEAGSYEYFCSFHPGMEAVVIVE